MAIMLNSRSNVYENIFFSVSQPPDSSTILQPAGIAASLDIVDNFLIRNRFSYPEAKSRRGAILPSSNTSPTPMNPALSE